MKLDIFVTNLGKYNEGELLGEWVKLPADADTLEAVFDRIGIDTYYEEYFITDYETDAPIRVDEFDRIEDLNRTAEKIAELDEYTAEIVTALMGDGYTLDEAIDAADDCIYYDGCSSMADVAEQYAEETGLLDSIPVNLQYYFDFEKLGRDMGLEGHFIETDGGIIQVL